MTFLFTDIEGSTRLLKKLGRDRYGDVLSTHNRLLRAAFSEGGGIEIDTKGDSFFVVFRSAGAAIEAVAAAQRALAEHEWPDEVEVRVRMGLHTGEASVGTDGYVGFAVHQAARIGDAGHGGPGAPLDARPRTSSGTTCRRGSGCSTSGATALPDFDRPERLFQLEIHGPRPTASRRSRRASARKPGRGSRGAARTSRSRARRCSSARPRWPRCRPWWPRATSGAGRVVAIEGRAGMGKTRLVAEVRSLAGRPASRCWSRAAPTSSRSSPTVSCASCSSRCWRRCRLTSARRCWPGTAGLSERLFGDEELTGAAGAATSRSRVMHGLYWLAANLAARRPTAIVIDDLHWADASSLRWLSFLGRRLEGLPLLVVLGMRPPEQSVETELADRADLRPDRRS